MGMFDGIFDTLGNVFGDIGSAAVDSFPQWAPVAADVATGGSGVGALLSTVGSIGDAVGAVGKAVGPFMPLASAGISSAGQASANQANLEAVQRQIDFQRESQGTAMDFNERMQQRQMDYEERMSGSSYQRSMADMAKAGLNPMLAFMKGGASTPAVSSPSVSGMPGAAAHLENVAAAGINAASQAASVRATLASASKMESEAALNEVMARKGEQDIVTSASSSDFMRAEAENLRERLRVMMPQEHALLASRMWLNGELSRLTQAETSVELERKGLTHAEAVIASYMIPEARNIGESNRRHPTWYQDIRPMAEPIARTVSSAVGAFAGARSAVGLRAPSEVIHRRGAPLP